MSSFATAFVGSEIGNAFSKAALTAGATKEEIAETLRVAQYISGISTTYTAAEALSELF